mmetsp:Transcript_4995/g.14005  ORF Transcript_4995/g.14005 Transcript_4995/m.14005 type:complete len:351 (+) Transcript_4995:226-1278(+)
MDDRARENVINVQNLELRGWPTPRVPRRQVEDNAGQGRKVAIIGAGNLGQAMAAHMSFHGYAVSLGNRTSSKLDGLEGLRWRHAGHEKGDWHTTPLWRVQHTPSSPYPKEDPLGLRSVVEGCAVIVLCVPAPGHRVLAEALADVLLENQDVVLHPGNLFGALEVHNILTKRSGGRLRHVTVSELESSLLTCRAPRMGEVEIYATKSHLGFATFPATQTERVMSFFHPLYHPYLVARPNVLYTSLHDLNFVVHPIVTLMNAGPIDRGQPFLYYAEGVTQHIAQLLEGADEERCRVIDALGMVPIPLRDWIIAEYRENGAQVRTLAPPISRHSLPVPRVPSKILTVQPRPTG